MKAASAGMIADLALEEQSFCYIATITRKDGQVIRIADCVADVVVAAQTYYGNPGFDISAITSASYGVPSSADMSVGLDDAGPITSAELNGGYFDGAEITVDMPNYLTPANGVINVFRGKIAQVEQVDTYTADLRLSGFSSDLLEIIVETYGPDCRAPYLGHPRCGVDIASYTRTATVATVAANGRDFTITVTEPLAVDGWFANGAVEFTSGDNDGLVFDIRAWTDATNLVSLWLPPFGEVQVGDTLNIAPGCDKTAATCFAKFNNILNFQGFPFMPAASELVCDNPATAPPRPPPGGTQTVIC